MAVGFRDLEQIGRGMHLALVPGVMKRVQDRHYGVASREPGGSTGLGVRSAGPSYDRDMGLSDDAIDVVAVVAAIVLLTLITLAC